METDDLIEISAEDDSLLSLEQVPSSPQVFSSSNSSIAAFSCSPLVQIPRSNRSCARPPLPLPPIRSALDCAKEVGDADAISPSTAQVGIDKENAEMNSSEAPKLGVERQQMKRKKKGGGYNLRKSLAWDRAFFTEEGVLDPVELSMLSGNVGSGSRDRLSMIHEEVELVSQRLESISESRNSHSVGDKSIKKSPASSLKSRKMEGGSSLKARPSTRSQASPLSSPVKPKAISARDANKSPSTCGTTKSASKYSGCPRPVASSSLKRPLQPNVSRVANRDPKVSKLSAPKTNPPLSSATSRSSASSARNSKHSHVSQPAVQAPKTMQPKSSCGSSKISRNDIKPAHSGKSSARPTVQLAGRNVVKSVPEKHSSANRELPKPSKAADDSPVLQNAAVACPVSSSDGCAMKHAVSVSQNGNYNVNDTKTAQSQPAKPSGLRKPSPSLRYFEQSKPSGSQDSELGNLPLSGTPSHQKPPLPPKERAVHASSVYGASPVQIKFNSNRNDELNKQTQALHKAKSCDTVDCQQLSHNANVIANLQSQVCVKSHAIEKISPTGDIGSGNNSSLFLQENPSIVTKVDIGTLAAKTSMSSNQHVEGAEGSVSGRAGSASLGYQYVEDAVESSDMPKDQLSTFPDGNKKSKENELLELKNNDEGGDYSILMEDTVSNIHRGQVDQCSNDTAEGNSTAESQRLWVNDVALAEGKTSSSTDDASLKVEASPSDYDIPLILDAGTNVPNGVNANVTKYPGEDAGMQPLEASQCGDTNISMTELELPQIINCEADGQMDKAGLAPVPSHPADSNLSLDSKGENCLPDACPRDESPSQMQPDNSLLTNLVSPDLQAEDASGDVDRSKGVTACTEASRPAVLQSKKTYDHRDNLSLAADLENQIQEAYQNSWECNNSSTINVFATGESRNDKHGESQLEVMNLDSEFACDQNMIDETLEGDTEILESDGLTSADISNVITHEASYVNNTCDQSQSEAVSPENEFSRDQHPIEETKMEDAEVQDCDGGSFVNTINVTNFQMPGLSEENIKCGQSQWNAMRPATIGETIMEDNVEVQDCDDSSFVDFSNVINSQGHKESEDTIKQSKSDNLIEEVPLDIRDSCLRSSLLLRGNCSADDRDASWDTSVGSPEFKDPIPEEVKNPASLFVDDKSRRSSDIQQSSENNILARLDDNCCMHGDQVSQQITKSVSPLRSSDHEIQETACTSDSSTVKEKPTSQVNPSDSVSEESMVQDMDVESSEEDDTLLEVDKRPDIHGSAFQHDIELDTLTCSIETVDEKKKEADAPAAIKLPPDAAPFSEEWLAAIEAAGEEILTKKSGAVQHSPPEKTQPEPGPWSPVKKRKNQEIGPFDCTKYTNKSEP
ncbi:unnamed protein product [Linum tenue]|uniref:Uncharacterized protein n=2 Tax=Linum tenue TaxID=586396 RepID=A0AAV0QKD6_9ROSI|nr:unnamed protein product [Linum tenue]